jgi:hypothetical protein
MARTQILITAMTHMKAGICTAGFTGFRAGEQPRWVRPVLKQGDMRLELMTTAEGRVVEPGDVVELDCPGARPCPPHVEDLVTNYFRPRVRIVETLEPGAFARFLLDNLDAHPEEVLSSHPTRSLCLLRPDEVHATFALHRETRSYEARLCFRQGGMWRPHPPGGKGWPVTGLRWRDFGQRWLEEHVAAGVVEARADLAHADLLAAWEADAVVVSIGLSREFNGNIWPLVISVFPVRCPG